MNVTRIGVDLAKSVFQVHGVDVVGHAIVRRRLARSQLLAFFGRLPACIIGMEACSSAGPLRGLPGQAHHNLGMGPDCTLKPGPASALIDSIAQ